MFTYDVFRKRTNGHLEWACGANTETWARLTASMLSSDERTTVVVMRTYPNHSTRILCTFCCGQLTALDPVLGTPSRDISKALQ